jgi:hypothetical protein
VGDPAVLSTVWEVAGDRIWSGAVAPHLLPVLLASPEWAKFMADHDGNDYDTKRRLLILFAGKHMCFRDALLSLEMNCMNGIITYLPTAVYCLE